MNAELTDSNFTLYAAKYYNTSRCINDKEFYQDLARISSIKRLLNRYQKGRKISVRLLLNHVITFFNMFEIAAANDLLMHRMKDSEECLPYLKTCLIYLNYLPEDNAMKDIVPSAKMADDIRRETQ